MDLSLLDKQLLRGILQGLSSSEVAAQTGLPPPWVEARSRLLFGRISEISDRGWPERAIEHPRLASLLHLWATRSGAQTGARNGTLRLTDLQPWIEHTLVVELAGAPPQPKVRIMGRKPLHYLGGDFSGKYVVDHIPEEAHLFALEPYWRAVLEGAPQYDVLGSSVPGYEDLRFHRLILPHFANGRATDIVLVTAYLEMPGKNAELPQGVYELKPRKAGCRGKAA